ncbi:nucleic acid/nucleotide deaminase domain-containing protein [Nocardia gipuzkoensis]
MIPTVRLWLAILILLATALFGAPTPALVSADPASPEPKRPTSVPFNGTAIAQINNLYRARYRTSPARNVSTFQYTKDGQAYYVTVASVSSQSSGPKIAVFNVRDAQGNLVSLPDKDGTLRDEVRVENETITVDPQKNTTRQTVSGKHSEELTEMILEKWGINPDAVTQIFSELEPCDVPGHNCGTRIVPKYKNADVSYNFEYHGEIRGEGTDQLGKAVENLYDELDDLEAMLQAAPPHPAAVENSRLAHVLTGLRAPPPGGIDFSTLQLRYLSDAQSDKGAGLQYSFSAATGGNPDTAVGRAAVLQSSDAFFVWLALSRDRFWVNLNPSEPNRIIDSELGRTDAGRILLQADLQLKKTVGRLIHPDTDLGKNFWQQLNSNNGQLCLSFRQWIVPGEASVRQDSSSLYIISAPLEVKLESDYLKEHGESGNAAACPAPDKSVQRHNEQVFRTLILPKVQEAVNTAPEYTELRRVYLSRIAAEWYRQRGNHQQTDYSNLIDSNSATKWPARVAWSPKQVFDQYVDSYKHGEFNLTRQNEDGKYIYTNTYIFGGVDFSNVSLANMDAAEFHQQFSDADQVIKKSLEQPTIDDQNRIWLGSPGPAVSNTAATSSGTVWQWATAALIGVLVMIFMRSVVRNQRRRR